MPNDIAATVQEWFRRRCACGPLARDTEAYNQVSAALPDLITSLSPPSKEPAADDAQHEQEH